MPVEFGIWRIDEGVVPVPSSPIENEAKLEDILEEDLSILGLDVLLLIGRQVITALGKRIDLFAMNSDGDLYAVELKRGRTPREVVAQTIDYGYWLRDLDSEGVIETFEKHNSGTSFEVAFRDRFDADPPEELAGNHNLIIVASELDASTERIVDYISDYGVPLNVVFFQHFRDGDREYLARSWLIDPLQVESPTKGPGKRKARAPWNGQDFHVSFGEFDEPERDRRRWEDAVKYGFISAGGGEGGRHFSRALEQLRPGHRMFVHIPKRGYVGVGTVTESSQRIRDFKVDVNGKTVPILEAPLVAKQPEKYSDDPEKSEYVVRVNWIKTLPREKAVWEKGMYANQNSATKLRHQFTLERLIEAFDLEREDSE
jgi:hypothetical protein